MAERAVRAVAAPERPSFVSRLFAWWRKPAERSAVPAIPDANAESRPPPPAVEEIPPLDPYAVAQWLWGDGFLIPGGHEATVDLVKPFALNPAMSVADVAAGLGGAARAMAEEFSTYVTAYERNIAIARRGMEISVAQGLARRAPVTAFDPETFELRSGAFDCILATQATYNVVEKERFLRVLVVGLKSRGQLLLTDFTLDPAVGHRRELSQWAAHLPYRPSLWTIGQYKDCLASLGVDIRITEEISVSYRHHVLTGWNDMLHKIDLRSLPRPHLISVVDEAERWMRTIAALDTGALKLYRIYALAGRKG